MPPRKRDRRGPDARLLARILASLGEPEGTDAPARPPDWKRLAERLVERLEAQRSSVEALPHLEQAQAALAESEEKYRQLFELESDALFLIDNEEGRILEVNPAATQLYGYSRQELVTLRNVDLSAEPEQTRAATAAGLSLVPIRYHRKKDGSVMAVEITARHLLWKGRPAHIAAIRDITERLRVQEEMERQRAFLRTIIDADPNVVSVKDREGRYLLANQALADFCGVPLKMLVGRIPTELPLDPAFAQSVREDDLALLSRRAERIDREHQMLHRDGRSMWVRSTKLALKNAAGEVDHIVSYTFDITQLKMTEEALRESEANYRLLFMHNPMPMLVFDVENLAILAVNDAAVKHYGYSREEFHAMTVRDIRPEEDVPRFLDHLAKSLPEIDRTGYWKHKKKDGTIIDVEVTSHLSNFAGRPVRIVLINDVTERLRAEEAARRHQHQIATLLDTLPAFAFLKDAESVYRVANRRFCEAVGCPPGEIAGKTDFELYPRELAEKYRQDDARVLSGGQTFMAEQEEIEGDRRLIVEVRKVPLRDEAGRVIGLIGMEFDITERKRAEAERRKLEQQVQHAQKLESLGVLAGGIAHDFNNLLTGILGHADLALLEMSPLSPARESLRQIEASARRAAELTRQMLAYSGRGKFVIQPVQISEVVQEMSHLLEISISKKCVLKYHFADHLPAIEADVTQLRQVVMNLIINASEAIGEASGVIVISTGAVECDRAYLAGSYIDEDLPPGLYVYLEVADTGCGMTPETLARVFDPFFSTKFTGRGLGLAAVLGIVRGHRGAIKVYSEPGRGTTFKVLFPASSRPVQNDAVRQPAAARWRGVGLILVVDDEETVRTLARRMLERLGFTVLVASDGQEGVEIFRQHADEVRAVLLDMTMPHMDGEEAFRELRRIRPDVRVVLSSGYNEQDATNRFAGKGLAGFIQKPYCLEDLCDVIRRALGE